MNEPRKTVFLDRDGVINKERSDYVKTVDELEIFPHVAKLIKKLKDGGFLVVVITNQSAINRGLTTHENVQKIHQTIQDYLRKNGTFIDCFFYCPHKPNENCNCRKPKPGLLKEALKELNIDIKSSWLLGDDDTDIQAASSIGFKSIMIRSQVEFEEAVNQILNSEKPC